MENKKEFLAALEEASKVFNKVMDQIEQEQEDYWTNLSKEDQLKAFCAVSRRIYDGEIKQHRSYRGMLYDVFGFGPDAYVQAQMSGYLSIHNAIFDSNEIDELVKEAVAKEREACALLCEQLVLEVAHTGMANAIRNRSNVKGD